MTNKKNSIWHNPALPAAGIAALLSLLASTMGFDVQTMKIINTLSPPVSILLSYTLVWITAKFSTFSILEQRALARLNAREKLIRKELKKDLISAKSRKMLIKELEEIIYSKSQVGKDTNIIDEVQS